MDPYPNPPIKEALIDIKIDPLSASELAALESLYDRVRGDYPVKKARNRWESAVEFKDDKLVSSDSRDCGPDGFLFISQDEKQVVQYRLDGFMFNRLAPYPRQGWPVIQGEARKLWEHYLGVVRLQRIVRIGLRYINQINIPAPDQQFELEDYFTEPPRIPKDIPQKFEHFLVRLVIPWSVGAKAVITQTRVPSPTPDMMSFILDIDVLTENPGSLDTASVWNMLERFREFKNTIFESSLTPKTKELFR